MAFQDLSLSDDRNDEFKEGFFNLTLAVGDKEVGTRIPAANIQTDMMLVYYMLFFIYRDGDKKTFPLKSADNFRSPDRFPTAKNYSSADTKTKIAGLIFRFQQDLKRGGRNVFVDGRCDRARGVHTTITHSVFSIVLMNFHFASTVKLRDNRRDWQKFALSDPLAPPQLRQELATNIDLG